MVEFVSGLPWYVFVVVGLVLLAVFRRGSEGATGGTGKVVGVVGRMGSGKTLFAVRLAHRRMSRGANVRTNFTMHLTNLHPDRPCPPKCEESGRCSCERPRRIWNQAGTKRYRSRCLCQMRAKWSQWHGWEELVGLRNAVVIVDEAHIMAPSLNPHAIPEAAKWALSMARKHRVDLYWISQHEDRVTKALRDLTNVLYHCTAWYGAKVFLAKGYEPERMRKKNEHLERIYHTLRMRTADLYDTLEVMRPDEAVSRDGSMAKVEGLVEQHRQQRESELRGNRRNRSQFADEMGLNDGLPSAEDGHPASAGEIPAEGPDGASRREAPPAATETAGVFRLRPDRRRTG
jgi:hypothetical protein